MLFVSRTCFSEFLSLLDVAWVNKVLYCIGKEPRFFAYFLIQIHFLINTVLWSKSIKIHCLSSTFHNFFFLFLFFFFWGGGGGGAVCSQNP